MELITLTSKTRGRGSREVEYQGIGRIERSEPDKDGKTEEVVKTDGVVTSIEDFIKLTGVTKQQLLDFAAVGYNKFQREQALDVDEFKDFIGEDWDEKKIDQFKRSVRAFAKVAELDTAEAAEFVLSKMKKAEAVTA